VFLETVIFHELYGIILRKERISLTLLEVVAGWWNISC